jgi:hypothetical protein
MLNEVKHLAIAHQILRRAQNDIIHNLTYDNVIAPRLLCIFEPRLLLFCYEQSKVQSSTPKHTPSPQNGCHGSYNCPDDCGQTYSNTDIPTFPSNGSED